MKLCYKVVCLIFALFVRSGAQQNGDIKLEGDASNQARGRLEVFKNGTWINMCYDYLVPNNKTQRGSGVAQAACRQLGYNDYAHVGNVTTFGLPPGSGGADKLSNGDCLYYDDPTNAPQHIFRCAFLGGNCSHGDDMAIECGNIPPNWNYFDTMVNLVQDYTDLPSSASNSSGFAQIYLNGNWGPVCNMQKTEADTFCRQLSYTNAVSVKNMKSSLTNHPLLDNFQCNTNHSGCLRNCFDYPKVNKVIECTNFDYSYVTCTYVEDTQSYYGTKFSCTSGAKQNGDIKLEGNATNPARGRLEVYKNGTWTNICYDYLVPKTQRGVAQAACRQLGYNDSLHVGNVTTFGLPPGSGGADKLSNGDCLYFKDPANAPQHIFKCAFLGGNCSHGDDMAIECEDSPRSPFDTMVNLQQYSTMVNLQHNSTELPSSASNSSGFANIYLNEQWGSVCDMQKTEADTFCRQLSYTNAVSVENRNSTLTNVPRLAKFQCKTNHSGCLRSCFDYPKFNHSYCSNGYSYVTCTFVEDTQSYYGTKFSCAGGFSKSGAVAGVVIAILMVAIAIPIVTALVCIYMPGCYFHRGLKGSYTPGATTYRVGDLDDEDTSCASDLSDPEPT